MADKLDISGHLDRYDLNILKILSKQGRLPITDLEKGVGLSKPPCLVR
jgi:Lrp/AsnC family leucine-responsive transcriptional regulator